MRDYIEQAVDEIDAAVFSGDFLWDKEERAEFKEKLESWQRAITAQEELEKGFDPEEDKANDK